MDNASIYDEKSKGLAPFAFPEAISSKTGVSVSYQPAEDKQWFVLRIKYGKMQAVADTMIESGTYVYLAKVWKDVMNKVTGKKQRKLFPFMNILFAYTTAQEAEQYVKGGKESDYITYSFCPCNSVTGRTRDGGGHQEVSLCVRRHGASHFWPV